MGSDSEDYPASLLHHAASIAQRKAIMGGIQRTLEEMKRWQRSQGVGDVTFEEAEEEEPLGPSDYGSDSAESSGGPQPPGGSRHRHHHRHHATHPPPPPPPPPPSRPAFKEKRYPGGAEETDTDAAFTRLAANHRRVKAENERLREENARLRQRGTGEGAPAKGPRHGAPPRPAVARSPPRAWYGPEGPHSPPTRHPRSLPAPELPVDTVALRDVGPPPPAGDMQTELGKKWQARLALMNGASTLPSAAAPHTTAASQATFGPPQYYHEPVPTQDSVHERAPPVIQRTSPPKRSVASDRAAPGEEYTAALKRCRALQAECTEWKKEAEEQRAKCEALVKERRQEAERARGLKETHDARVRGLEERLEQQAQAHERALRQQARELERERGREKDRHAAVLRDREAALQQELQAAQTALHQKEQQVQCERTEAAALLRQAEADRAAVASRALVLEASLEATRRDLEGQVAAHVAQLQAIEVRYAEGQELLRREQARAMASEARAEELGRQLEGERQQHTDQVAHLNTVIQELQAQADQHQRQAQTLKAALKKVEAKLRDQEEGHLRSGLEWERQLRDAHTELAAAQTQDSERVKELTQCKRRLKETQDKARALNEQLREAVDARLGVERVHSELEAQVRAAASQADRRAADAAAREQQLAGELQAARQAVAALQEELQQERQRCVSEAAASEAHVAEVARLRDALSQAEQLHQEQQSLILRAQQELRREQLKRSQAEDRLNTLARRWKEERQRDLTVSPGPSPGSNLTVTGSAPARTTQDTREEESFISHASSIPGSAAAINASHMSAHRGVESFYSQAGPPPPPPNPGPPLPPSSARTNSAPAAPPPDRQPLPTSAAEPVATLDGQQRRRQVPRSLAPEFDLQAARDAQDRQPHPSHATGTGAYLPPAVTTAPRHRQSPHASGGPPPSAAPSHESQPPHPPQQTLPGGGPASSASQPGVQSSPSETNPSPISGPLEGQAMADESPSDFSDGDEDDDDFEGLETEKLQPLDPRLQPLPGAIPPGPPVVPGGFPGPPSMVPSEAGSREPPHAASTVSFHETPAPRAPQQQYRSPSIQPGGEAAAHAQHHMVPYQPAAVPSPPDQRLPHGLWPAPQHPFAVGHVEDLQGMARNVAQFETQLDAMVQQSRAQLQVVAQQVMREDAELAVLREQLRPPVELSFTTESTGMSSMATTLLTARPPVATERRRPKRRAGARRAQTPSLTSSSGHSGGRERRCRSAHK